MQALEEDQEDPGAHQSVGHGTPQRPFILRRVERACLEFELLLDFLSD
jgi:hypothetical protein